MKIEKSFKASWPDGDGWYRSRGFSVELDTADLGLDEPKSAEEARSIAAELSHQAEALLLIEKAKAGLIHPQQLAAELAPWLPTKSTS